METVSGEGGGGGGGGGGVITCGEVSVPNNLPGARRVTGGYPRGGPLDFTVGPTPGGKVGSKRADAVLHRVGHRKRERHREAQPRGGTSRL